MVSNQRALRFSHLTLSIVWTSLVLNERFFRLGHTHSHSDPEETMLFVCLYIFSVIQVIVYLKQFQGRQLDSPHATIDRCISAVGSCVKHLFSFTVGCLSYQAEERRSSTRTKQFEPELATFDRNSSHYSDGAQT